MKRYSVSYAQRRDRRTGKVGFQYSDRTDDVELEIDSYLRSVENWKKKILDETYQYRSVVYEFIGIRIVDSETKEVVFEDIHTSEELGWKKVYTGIYAGEWVRV